MPQPINVLLVDDEELFIEALKPALRRRGLHVQAVGLGEAALALLAQTDNIDVIVLDLQLPGLSGIETLASCTPACFTTLKSSSRTS